MAVLPIVTTPAEILTNPGNKITHVDKDVEKLIVDMRDTLNAAEDPEGAGIAAPQIGSSKRVCIVRNFSHDKNTGEMLTKDTVLINPKITSHSKEQNLDWEGCLSVPDTYGKVQRYNKVKMKALDELGNSIRLTASGFFARTIQHEIDHLNGILFTSKVWGNTLTKNELEALEKNTS